MYLLNRIFIILILTGYSYINAFASEVDKTLVFKTLKYAKTFQIAYLNDGLKILKDASGRSFILVPEGKSVPDEYKNYSKITTPVRKAIYTSTSQLGLIRSFADTSVYNSIAGVRGGSSDITFEPVHSLIKSGRIVDVGGKSGLTMVYNYELIGYIKPDIIFTGYHGMDELKLSSMLDKVGITYLQDGSANESDYRGTLEWIKFYAAFYNMDKEAEKYYDEAIKRIDKIIAITKTSKNTPKVGFGIINSGTIYVDSGGSKTATMVSCLGGEYIFKDINADKHGFAIISSEEFYNRFSKGGIYIDKGMPKYGKGKKSIINQIPVLSSLPIFKQGMIYKITDSFWTDYYDIDRKYLELGAILYPELFKVDNMRHFIHLVE